MTWRPLVLGLAIGLAGCHPKLSPANPGPDADAAPAPSPPPVPVPTGYTCTDACAHRQALGCDFQDGCLDRCTSIADQRFTDCETTAVSCAKINGCDPANQH